MKKIFLISVISALLSSCCVYHSSQIIDDKKISEIGIAPYSNRPSIQEAENEK